MCLRGKATIIYVRQTPCFPGAKSKGVFRMRVQLDHIGIAVTGLKESLEFYTGILGLEIASTSYVASQGVSVAMLSSKDAQEATKLELLETTDPQSALGRFLNRSGAGLHHLAVRVENLEEALAEAEAQGLELVGEPQKGAESSRFVFAHPRSAGGVLLEILQRESL